MNRDLLWIILHGQGPAQVTACSVIDPLDVTATPMRARFHTGVNLFEVAAGIAVLVLCFNLALWWLWALLAAFIGGSVYVRFHWAEMTIDDTTITVVRHRPFRPDQTQVENRADYVSLGFTETCDGGRKSFRPTFVDRLLEPRRQVLFLRHKDDFSRNAPVFWTTDREEIAQWQPKLAAALGVRIEEIASNGETIVDADDVTKPLAIRVAPEDVPAIDLDRPPDGVTVVRQGDTLLLTLPDDARSRMGKRVATAILVLPLLIPFMLMAPPALQVIFAIGFVLIVVANRLSGDWPEPPPAHRLKLFRDKGMRLHFPRLYWPSWRSIRWSDLLAVEIGYDHLVIRDHRGFCRAGTALPRPTLEWLRSFITAAAVNAVKPSAPQEKTAL